MKKILDFINREGFELTSKIWWMTFIVTVVPALFLTNIYDNLAFLWIIGVPMIMATLLVGAFNCYGIYNASGPGCSLDLPIGFFLFLIGILFIAPAVVLTGRSIWWLWLFIAPIMVGFSLMINNVFTTPNKNKKPR